MPNYQALVDQSVRPVDGGGTVFVGQRDDPFFIDLGVTFDLINFRDNTTGNAGGYKDDIAGYSVHSFVLELPDSALARDSYARKCKNDRENKKNGKRQEQELRQGQGQGRERPEGQRSQEPGKGRKRLGLQRGRCLGHYRATQARGQRTVAIAVARAPRSRSTASATR